MARDKAKAVVKKRHRNKPFRGIKYFEAGRLEKSDLKWTGHSGLAMETRLTVLTTIHTKTASLFT